MVLVTERVAAHGPVGLDRWLDLGSSPILKHSTRRRETNETVAIYPALGPKRQAIPQSL